MQITFESRSVRYTLSITGRARGPRPVCQLPSTRPATRCVSTRSRSGRADARLQHPAGARESPRRHPGCSDCRLRDGWWYRRLRRCRRRAPSDRQGSVGEAVRDNHAAQGRQREQRVDRNPPVDWSRGSRRLCCELTLIPDTRAGEGYSIPAGQLRRTHCLRVIAVAPVILFLFGNAGAADAGPAGVRLARG